MDLNKIYGRWMVWDEFGAIPLVIISWLKGKKIKTLLEERIKKAQEIAAKTIINSKNREEYLLEYDSLDNFFAYHFKNIEKSRTHSFEEKIAYCLQQYKAESFRNISASRAMLLQENFLIGAEKTLTAYLLLDKKVERRIYLKDILIGDDTEEKFKIFLKDKRFIDDEQNLLVDNKSSFIRLHRFLKDENFINSGYTDNTIIEIMEKEYNSTFDKTTFSRANKVLQSDFEKDIFKELSAIMGVRY